MLLGHDVGAEADINICSLAKKCNINDHWSLEKLVAKNKVL
jgi:hypothetical protein